MSSIDNRRIAKNTIYLYVRTFISMIVSLYTSRIILEALGIVDFGVFNVVGGVIGMTTFLNGSMSVATQRYLTYELGREDTGNFNKVFSMAVNIHLAIAFIVVILAETAGLWFVNNKLVIPADRLFAANCVYQATILSATLGIIQTPYNASIISHERMYIYAWIGLGETFVKLGLVMLLAHYGGDRLAMWAFWIFTVQLVISIYYRYYCIHYLPGCRYNRGCWDRNLFRQMLKFTGWNMFGTAAWALKDQGASVLLNLFGGPVANAARGVAGQVNGAVRGLISGFQTAVNPQLTKTYAGGESTLTCRLLCQSSKISFFLMFLIALPLCAEIDFVLNLWLIDVPKYAGIFSILVILDSLFDTLAGPMITALLATGNIKWYQIVVGCILLLNIPCAYIWLRLGGPIETPLIVSIIFMIAGNISRLFFCRNMLGLSLREYFKEVVLPIMIVFTFGVISMAIVNHFMEDGWLRLFTSIIVSITVIFGMAYTFGLKHSERKAINDIARKGLLKLRIA